VKALNEVRVPVAPINQVDQIVEDPHIKYRGMIVSLEHPEAGTVRSPNFPVKFSKTPADVSRPAPLLGQHNEEVLEELGYGKERIQEFRKDGVIT
jgi:crotonobetainyl-CoA:carnitine CoA-transferase CaiB-like acyl-CoA transferase